jgi:hypothetical protein
MLATAKSGKYEPGIGSFQTAFRTSDYWICQAGYYICSSA